MSVGVCFPRFVKKSEAPEFSTNYVEKSIAGKIRMFCYIIYKKRVEFSKKIANIYKVCEYLYLIFS